MSRSSSPPRSAPGLASVRARLVSCAGALLVALAAEARGDEAVRYRSGPVDAPLSRAGVLDPCDPRCEPRRGPLEVRDMYLLAQPRLTLPPTTPDTLGCGRSSLRLHYHWSNSFGWRQSVTGEDPMVRYFLVDGEARTVEATWMHGATDDLDVGLRLPLHWRGAGVLDDVIDAFHGIWPELLLDNKRKDFVNDKFRVHGRLEDGTPFSWDQDKGIGLGNLEGIARWRCCDGGRDGTSLALVGRVTAPTGSAPFDPEGVEVGVQCVAARRVAPRLDVFAGIGETWYQEPSHAGIRYARWRTHLFGALEWRFHPRASLLFQMDYGGPLAADVANFAPDILYAHVGVKWDLDPRTVLEVGFTENLVNQQTTSDFGAFLGVEFRW